MFFALTPVPGLDVGSSISAGYFSRGRWHEIRKRKDEADVALQARLMAPRKTGKRSFNAAAALAKEAIEASGDTSLELLIDLTDALKSGGIPRIKFIAQRILDEAEEDDVESLLL
jgi:hypothetical protein